jgi:hypothetical protein
MTKTKAGMAAALVFGAASLLFSVPVRAMPIDGLATATPTISFKLSILRLLGALGERKPPFGHFDEKGFVRRSASLLRQSNAFSSVLA